MTDTAVLAEFADLLEGDLETIVTKLRDSRGRIVLNADDLFRLCDAYHGDPDARMRLGPQLYPIASRFTDRAYAFLLSLSCGTDDLVVFTAGGAASGKSSALRAQHNLSGVNFIVDTTFSNPERALGQVDRALAAGRRVLIHYVFRPFDDSVIGMLERALDPANRRVVPVDDMARTHVGSQDSIVLASEKYNQDKSDNRVDILLWENVDRNKVRKISRATFSQYLHPAVDVLTRGGQNILDEIYEGRFSKWGHQAIPESLYQAASSKPRSR